MKGLSQQRKGLLLFTLAVFYPEHLLCQPATEGSEIVIARSFARKPIPLWTGGYLLGFELYPTFSPLVFAYDRSGRKLFEVSLALDGAGEVFLNSMAASGDGRFAFCGTAVSGSGARAGFIAFLDQAGRIVKINRPERFFPKHLCFTGDGALWSAGSAGNVDGRGEVDHAVLRGYSTDGKLKFALLPRSSFAPVSADLALNPHPAVDANTVSQLATNNRTVVFLTAGFREIIGISLDGQLRFRKPVDKPSSCDFITGFSVAPDGRILISCAGRGDSARKTEFSFHRFDLQSGSWARLYVRSADETGLPKALGLIDGDQMLIQIDDNRFRWMSRLP
jgi:hypothetical protein